MEIFAVSGVGPSDVSIMQEGQDGKIGNSSENQR